MTDPRNTLQAKFQPARRFDNFGSALTQIRVQGFRGHADSVIDLRSPITALCGINGSGKSTIAELAACAYRAINGRQFNVSTFFVSGTLDPHPFTAQASASFRFWKNDRSEGTISLVRDEQSQRWRGYQGRPQRHVEFVAADIHVPRVERRDFVLREASRLQLGTSTTLQDILPHVQSVLGLQYTRLSSQVVRGRTTEGKVMAAERNATQYSEIHMGCGEGRINALVERLEAVPDKSLIILEEPESALHQSAQFRLGLYLIDLSCRKGHQIILTTHSDVLLSSLPSLATVFLHVSPEGLKPVPGIPPRQALGLLTEGHQPALTVIVEDRVAEIVLQEIVRRSDPEFLSTIRIRVGGYQDQQGQAHAGGKDAISAALKTLRDCGLPVAAVLDGDATEQVANYVFTLPGTRPPEHEVLAVAAVREAYTNNYGIAVNDVLAAAGDTDHHRLIGLLAERARVDRNQLTGELARVYATSLGPTVCGTLTEQLKEAATRR